MRSVEDTSALIKGMAQEAAERKHRYRPLLDRLLIPAALGSLALSIVFALTLFGIRPHLSTVLVGTPFLFKFATMLLLASGGLVAVRRAGNPGSGSQVGLALVPGVILLAAATVIDGSGFPILGRSGSSVPSCVGAIVLLSLPTLAVVLRVLKYGVPTQPARAGMSAGLLAGTIGGAAYAFVCQNDGAVFVAVWYGLAIFIVAGFGAVIGSRALSW
ncbi:DUF1109 domain-containing protein [Ensifer sp. ENS11]|uniref:NrsF family protein n=2 Tax=Sinorhizobium/Ensifer group TaxID=227292 RepID=UPI0007C93EEB|nr:MULTISPECIES: DUF1109 domain-containing protein [Ensifer]MBD9489483.1 DUF1109 domain-containing protein [Ensifer sp. ENS11]MDP9632680.1 hypothetical protein [Ensifer adhaerens]NOV17796.1 DUF1109 domain-containing protein [Ensifer canadensis]